MPAATARSWRPRPASDPGLLGFGHPRLLLTLTLAFLASSMSIFSAPMSRCAWSSERPYAFSSSCLRFFFSRNHLYFSSCSTRSLFALLCVTFRTQPPACLSHAVFAP